MFCWHPCLDEDEWFIGADVRRLEKAISKGKVTALDLGGRQDTLCALVESIDWRYVNLNIRPGKNLFFQCAEKP